MWRGILLGDRKAPTMRVPRQAGGRPGTPWAMSPSGDGHKARLAQPPPWTANQRLFMKLSHR